MTRAGNLGGLLRKRPDSEWGEARVGEVLMAQCPDCHGLYLVPIAHVCTEEEAQYTLVSETAEEFLALLTRMRKGTDSDG